MLDVSVRLTGAGGDCLPISRRHSRRPDRTFRREIGKLSRFLRRQISAPGLLAVIDAGCAATNSASRRSRDANWCQWPSDFGLRGRYQEACAGDWRLSCKLSCAERSQGGQQQEGKALRCHDQGSFLTKWLGMSSISCVFLRSLMSIFWAPAGALKPKSPGATSPADFQFLSWMLYCGPSATSLEVMTNRQG